MINTLHLGENIVLSDSEIIGIFSGPEANSGYLGMTASSLLLRNVTDKKRSFIITEKNGKYYVYYSKISGRNLIKRLKEFGPARTENMEELNG